MVSQVRSAMTVSPVSSTASGRRCGRIRLTAVGMSLGLSFAITFTLCVLFDALFPGWAMYRVWQPLFPGFVWLTWPSFFLGLAESFAYGWYVAVIFVPLYNLFAARIDRTFASHKHPE